MQLYNKYATVLKRIMKDGIKSGNAEKAMAAMASYAYITYEWNQFYTDDEVEKLICRICERLFPQKLELSQCKRNSILFYDGFGLDTRGLALIYLKALIHLGYHVIYVTKVEAEGKQPEIMKVLRGAASNVEYIRLSRSHTDHVTELNTIFEKYNPSKAMFYTMPDDIAAAVVFSRYKGRVMRYQINLTDHAFWIGKCAFDVCIEFREYGAGISHYHRGIDLKQIRILPFYPWVDKDAPFGGFDFSTAGYKIVFSGGALYKTLGGDNKYYILVDQILEQNKDTLFLYAGYGDDSELKKLEGKWGGRVVHISERKDLFALMQHIDVYLNTYPIIGGLMTQYAVIAGKIPLMLINDDMSDASGILMNQEKLGIEFRSIDAMLEEIHRLLTDEVYRHAKYDIVKRSVMCEAEFIERLEKILDDRDSTLTEIMKPETDTFRAGYRSRFSENSVMGALVRKKNKALFTKFPVLFARRIFNKLRK